MIFTGEKIPGVLNKNLDNVVILEILSSKYSDA